MLVWDVVFGVWVGWNARDRELLRTMADVQRRHERTITCSFALSEETP